ncbi:amidase family protein [Companilactobacillus mishanensis]|uniref:amidase family protein n=1 Tax=Companilactobacillus mishanensis TaxID=2486008 RepID=UPI001297690C|nr:amidase family protein [Companilactobacillus mishanensis]MQS90191.1 amidase [Companilactobacillus mishanensis]
MSKHNWGKYLIRFSTVLAVAAMSIPANLAFATTTSVSAPAPEETGSTTATQNPETNASTDINTTNTAKESAVSDFTLQDYENSTATELAQAVRSGKVTSVQLVNFAYQEIAAKDPELHAMITLRKNQALQEASELKDTGQPFYGVPLLLKGLGHKIVGGSASNGLIYAKDIVADKNSDVTKAFQDAGFIIVGQTNYPELGLKNITNSKLYGPTGNAWNLNYQSGGSSGGSASGVAAGYAPVATGSDAGGSIRIPASWNGIVGLKPSPGIMKWSKEVHHVQTSHFAETKNMTDTVKLFNNLVDVDLPDVPFKPDKVRIAYTTQSPVKTSVSSDAVKAVENAVQFLRDRGFEVDKVAYPIDGVKLMHNYYTLGSEGMDSIDKLSMAQQKRHLQIDDVDWTTWALYQYGKDTNEADYKAAWDSIDAATDKMEEFHQKYQLFLTPTNAYTAPKVNDTIMKDSDISAIKRIDKMTKQQKSDLVYKQWLPALTYTPFTQQANLTGEPAISLPTYVSSDGLPLGIQFNAARNQDRLLLSVGQYFESNGQFKVKAAALGD